MSNVWLLIVYDAKFLICEEFSISKNYPDHKVNFWELHENAPLTSIILKTFWEIKEFGWYGSDEQNSEFACFKFFRPLKKFMAKPVISFHISASSIFLGLNRSPCFKWWVAPRNFQGNFWKSKTCLQFLKVMKCC